MCRIGTCTKQEGVPDREMHKARKGAGYGDAQGRKGCRIGRCTRQEGVPDKDMHKAGRGAG